MVLHQKVNVIVLALALDHLRFKVVGHAPEVLAQAFNGIAIKHVPSVFSQEDQMYVHGKDTMPA